ncbi:MAG: ABC transporter ATP-binding protein [Candidatus Dormibacteria bacterium]
MTSLGAAVEVRDLCKYYGRGEREVRAVDGVTLSIPHGQFLSVVGRSGSGKTTLLDTIGLLARPTSGTIAIDGVEMVGLRDAQLADYRSHKLGFIFQDFNLLDPMTAFENVMLPVKYAGTDRRAARERARALLADVGLENRSHHRPPQMSGGEKQRVCIARALINQPAIVLGDEPTGNLDTETSHQLLELMRRINRQSGVTFIIVTHDTDLASRTERVIRLSDGRVVEDGVPVAPDELNLEPVAPARHRTRSRVTPAG